MNDAFSFFLFYRIVFNLTLADAVLVLRVKVCRFVLFSLLFNHLSTFKLLHSREQSHHILCFQSCLKCSSRVQTWTAADSLLTITFLFLLKMDFKEATQDVCVCLITEHKWKRRYDECDRREKPDGQTVVPGFKSSVNLIKSNSFKMDADGKLWTNEMLKPLRSFLFHCNWVLKVSTLGTWPEGSLVLISSCIGLAQMHPAHLVLYWPFHRSWEAPRLCVCPFTLRFRVQHPVFFLLSLLEQHAAASLQSLLVSFVITAHACLESLLHLSAGVFALITCTYTKTPFRSASAAEGESGRGNRLHASFKKEALVSPSAGCMLCLQRWCSQLTCSA